MKRTLFAGLAGALTLALLSGCSALGLSSGTPLTPAQVQIDVNNAVYLMEAAGCLTATAAAAAAPIVAVAADAEGNQILTATAASGAVLCKLTAPATALPVPAAPNAPAVSAPAAVS